MPLSEEAHLNDLIDQTLALPVHQRQAFLSRACSDPEMLAKIKKLLAHCESEVPDTFLRLTDDGKHWIENAYRRLNKSRQRGDAG